MPRVFAALLAFALALGPLPGWAQTAEPGRDHPRFPRLPNYVLQGYEQKRDTVKFPLGFEKEAGGTTRYTYTEEVEGLTTRLSYTLREGDDRSCDRQIVNYYAELINKMGGARLYQGDSERYVLVATFKVIKDGRDTWLLVSPLDDGYRYELLVLETGQDPPGEVTASDLLVGLGTQGRAILPLVFERGRAAIDEASRHALVELATMLKGDDSIRLRVEGYTDNQGRVEDNLRLSQARAQAVVDALVQEGVAGERLVPVGLGQERPLADNRSEEGRAQNRRVELVRE